VIRVVASFLKKSNNADINIQDTTLIEEKWFVYGPEKTEEVDKYISSR